MSNRLLVSSKAKWVLSELVPLVIVFGVGLFAIAGYIMESFELSMAIILGIAGFGLFLFLLGENLKRKKRSMLLAEMDKEDNYFLSVWMQKPKKDKWKGRLDKDKNTMHLSDVRRAGIISVEGTAVLVLRGEETENQIFIPTRLVENVDTVRQYLVDAFQVVRDGGNDVDTPKQEDATALKALLLGESVVNAVKEVARANEKIEKPEFELKGLKEKHVPAYRGTVNNSDDSSSEIEKKTAATENRIVDNKPIVATRAIGYDKYLPKSNSDLISEAIDNYDANVSSEKDTFTQTEDGKEALLIPGTNVSVNIPSVDASEDEEDKESKK